MEAPDYVRFWNALPEKEQEKLKFEFKLSMEGRDNFNSILIRLIAKADRENKRKLFAVFPRHVAVVHAYKEGLLK